MGVAAGSFREGKWRCKQEGTEGAVGSRVSKKVEYVGEDGHWASQGGAERGKGGCET